VAVDEKTLRETRTELAGGMADMYRQFGKLPDVRAIETLIDPVLNKVDQSSDPPAFKPEPKPTTRSVNGGEWYGEAGHSARVPEAQAGERVRLESKVLGDYALRGNRAVPLNGAPSRAPKRSKQEEFLRWVTRQLMHHPDFKRRFQEVTFSNLQGDAREKAYRKIYADAFRLFGDARAVWAGKPTDAKIIVGGK
jgi:hypothetical protein